MSIEERLAELGIVLPEPSKALANYVPFVKTGKLISISGQIPISGGSYPTGKVGRDLGTAEAARIARICAINIVAQAKAACNGNLERVRRIVRLGGFVNCTDDFTEQPLVINGASDLMVELFGEAGRHSRSAVGVNALPLGVPVEIDALIAIA